jgi:hypothetical protein
MMSRMRNILGHWLVSLRHYFWMCLLLSSPERLPYNPYAFALTVFAYFAIGGLLVDNANDYGVIAARILLEMAMLAAIVRVGLNIRQWPQRFAQTFSALVGINLLVTAVSIPLQALVGVDIEQPSALALYLFVVILVWNLAAISLVFKRAFEISTPLSAMLSFSYFVVNYIIVVLFV